MVVATWWWSLPLLLLSRYGVSIVPYTESAAVTTSVTSLSDIIRGTEDWVGYLVVNGQPWWQLGYTIATGVLPTLLTGLARRPWAGRAACCRGLPARRFLLCSVLAGVLIISAGYASSLGHPLTGPVDHLINGPASAFRNVRKFDPMIRLPVALGVAHLLAWVRLPRLRTAVAHRRRARRGRAGAARLHQRAGQRGQLQPDPALLGERGPLAERPGGPPGGAGRARAPRSASTCGAARWMTCCSR